MKFPTAKWEINAQKRERIKHFNPFRSSVLPIHKIDVNSCSRPCQATKIKTPRENELPNWIDRIQFSRPIMTLMRAPGADVTSSLDVMGSAAGQVVIVGDVSLPVDPAHSFSPRKWKRRESERAKGDDSHFWEQLARSQTVSSTNRCPPERPMTSR